jgi:hypothetical protein
MAAEKDAAGTLAPPVPNAVFDTPDLFAPAPKDVACSIRK